MSISKTRTWQSAAILVLALGLIAIFTANSVVATPPPQPPPQVSIVSTETELLNEPVTRPWTQAEMLAAKPYPMPQVSGPATFSTQPQAPTGAPGFVPAMRPNGKVNSPVGVDALIPQFAPAAPTNYSYPAPYTGLEIFTPYTGWPYVTIGKLFFKQSGVSYVCSAASIGNYAIWTAGHCVHKGNNLSTGWSTNVVFVPAYKDGAAPKGQWIGTKRFTTGAWYAYGNPNGLRYDYGGVTLKANTSGQKISQVVGALGFAWNFSYNQHWNALGYPAATPFNGMRLRVCEASFAYSLSFGTTGAVGQGIGCNMTGGCSGGPWILGFGTGNYLNGDNSYLRTSYTQEMNSPHLDNSAKSFYDTITTATP